MRSLEGGLAPAQIEIHSTSGGKPPLRTERSHDHSDPLAMLSDIRGNDPLSAQGVNNLR
jgi:hypothetical protein